MAFQNANMEAAGSYEVLVPTYQTASHTTTILKQSLSHHLFLNYKVEHESFFKTSHGIQYTPGVYQILCECSKVYVGHSGRTTESRYTEHQRYICLHQPKIPTVAEHGISTGHCINLNGISI